MDGNLDNSIPLAFSVLVTSAWAAIWLIVLSNCVSFEQVPAVLFLAMPVVAMYPAIGRALFWPPKRAAAIAVGLMFVTTSVFLLARGRNGSALATISAYFALYQMAIVGGGYVLFVKALHRHPKCVVFNFDGGLLWDRLYSISGFLLALLVPIWIAYAGT